MSPFSEVTRLIGMAIAAGAFPAASVEVGGREGVLWRHAAGTLTYDADARPADADTIFDLASLTKVIVTATLAMAAVDAERIRLVDRVGDWLPEWRGHDRADVTLLDLLAHASGLTAYLPLFQDCTGRLEVQNAICRVPLEAPPRTRAIYSDLGFILLGFILEDAHRRDVSRAGMPGATSEGRLASQFEAVAATLGPEPLTFNPPREWRDRTAPTEIDPWRGRLLVGEVHDENAWALGGAAGHAGLFGTVAGVGTFARAVLSTLAGQAVLGAPSIMRLFATPTDVPGSSRALGWDTMRPTSSCGTRLSPHAIGHTGFTGTSLWIDPERDLYIALLTNRVHPTRQNERIKGVRPAVHDAVVDAYDRTFG